MPLLPEQPKKPNKDRKDKLLAIDALIDSTLYKIKTCFIDFANVSNIVLSHFRFHGIKYFIVDLCCEFLTIAAVALLVFACLASYILELTQTDWQNKDHFSVTFLDRYNNVIGQRGALSGQSVPISEMPPYVIKAVLATEDRRFFSHNGLDFLGLARALSQNVERGGVVQGGSTLTQQLAKNLFLSNERTLSRKIKEAILAIWFEINYNKNQILQLYLDNAYMGGGNFGINAAAKFYFGKDIRHVNLAQAAMLAGLFKAPSKYAPHAHLKNAQERANVVLDNLVNSGFMNESEVIEARNHPATAIISQSSDTPDYFLDYAYEEIKKIKSNFNEPRLIVQTTLDPLIQQNAEKAVKFYLDNYGKGYHVSQVAAVILANNGSIRAMIGGRDYGESAFNRATHGGRQVGSSFKPYVYAVAMEMGLTPKTIVMDAPINWNGWQPHNDNNRYIGPVNLTTALTYSLNTVAVRLVYQYMNRDTSAIYNLVKNMGVESNILKHKTMVLGTSNMTALDQATAYNVFANGGKTGNRHVFLKICAADGRVLWQYKEPPLRQVLSPKATAYMNQMMKQVIDRGSGYRAAIPGIAMAGKTGTTQSYRDAWFVGYSGNFTAAIWMGNDNYKPTHNLFGGILPAMIFHSIMQEAHKTVKLQPLFGVDNNYEQQKLLQEKNAKEYSEIGILSPSSTDILSDLIETINND